MPTTTMFAHADSSPTPPPSGTNFSITGAGSSFVFPLMDKWRVEYNAFYPNVKLNYASVGSGAGITQFTKKTVDFGATDAPLFPSDMKAAPGALTFPESIGAITVSYNLYGVKTGLKLTGPTIASIFEGKIIYWDDPAIKNTNQGVYLPHARITVVHRSDGSGTTFAFTQYLSTVSPQWKHDIGFGKAVPWRAGIGAPNNAGVAHYVQLTPYSIGYVELAYAMQNKMTYAAVQNADGDNFVLPTIDTTLAAASQAASLPASNGDWHNVSIVNEPGLNSYPLASFTYIVAYSDLSKLKSMNADKAGVLVHLIWWMIHDGQSYAKPLWYVPLPDNVVQDDMNGLSMFKFGGHQLFSYTGGA
ncbi:MAG TPA: phosphate ABC transporter substrate-binding protein PstS [Candidatus Nitrosotalea sp.]|nr:phosphate ABC transporter substrate-binding protein PstS [Candidatus Nitrosotalea sp.]